MQKLHLVGVTTDHEGLILSTRRGARSGAYVLLIDEGIEAAIAEHQARRDEAADAAEEPAARPRVESSLSVKEIQARLRRGRSIAEVAKAAGVEPDWVERFAPPVLAERAQVVAKVQAMPLRRSRLGDSALPIGDAVRRHLADRGVSLTADELAERWSAHQVDEGRWAVQCTFRYRGRDQVARYDLDEVTGTVVAADRLSGQLGYVAPVAAVAPSRPSGASDRAATATRSAGARSRPAKERELAAQAMREAVEQRAADTKEAARRRQREREQAEVQRLRQEREQERAAAAAERAAGAKARQEARARETAERQARAAQKAAAALQVKRAAEAARAKAAAKKAADIERATRAAEAERAKRAAEAERAKRAAEAERAKRAAEAERAKRAAEAERAKKAAEAERAKQAAAKQAAAAGAAAKKAAAVTKTATAKKAAAVTKAAPTTAVATKAAATPAVTKKAPTKAAATKAAATKAAPTKTVTAVAPRVTEGVQPEPRPSTPSAGAAAPISPAPTAPSGALRRAGEPRFAASANGTRAAAQAPVSAARREPVAAPTPAPAPSLVPAPRSAADEPVRAQFRSGLVEPASGEHRSVSATSSGEAQLEAATNGLREALRKPPPDRPRRTRPLRAT